MQRRPVQRRRRSKPSPSRSQQEAGQDRSETDSARGHRHAAQPHRSHHDGSFLLRDHAAAQGLIIGAGEKLAEVFIGPLVGGGIENWFAYMLALGFLLFRPQGLFGERIIERV